MRIFSRIILFSIVFWNLENYFDCVDSGKSSSDAEFSARGSRHWTRKRFDAKTAMIGKTLLWCEELPSVVGVAEIENATVLKNLVYGDVLRKCEYSFIHYESGDPRGIDVAMLYRPCEWEKMISYPLPVIAARGDSLAVQYDTLRTRDILYVCLKRRSDASLWHFFVNHHPSKYGGASSSPRRVAAMETLRRSVDSLLVAGERNIVAMGDFNDVPQGEAFSRIDDLMVNMGAELLDRLSPVERMGTGTIRFHGNWQLIDNFLVSPDLLRERKPEMEIIRPAFLMQRDNQYPGEKPLRTYIGPRYNGGVSDHLPVMLDL